MRGTLIYRHLGNRVTGIIPAYAGNTAAVYVERVCVGGSSPRMRGTPDLPSWSRTETRIIPAYAGNTRKAHPKPQTGRDHPRVCGEHVTPWRDSEAILGSSPRMRGTQVAEGCAERISGIIPAYAGNTAPCSPTNHGSRDHPRVCGEHVHLDRQRGYSAGSSPRMRGTQRAEPLLTAMNVDHPRVCGEHPRAPIMKFHGAGSSPRMRGTQNLGNLARFETGIIPAYAGNTRAAYHPP